jgi:hypothetical protein
MRPEEQNEEPPSKLEELVDQVKECVTTKSKIAALKATEKVSNVSGLAVSYLVFGFIAMVILILLSIGAAHYISSRMGDSFSGFFFVAGAYAVILLFLILGRNAIIKRPVANKIISEMLND